MTNQEVIDSFFEHYVQRDFAGIKRVLDENAEWYFLGNHPLAGIKKGIDEIVSFFDSMGTIMRNSSPSVEKLIITDNGGLRIECQHISTNRADGNNLNHYVCVLWTIENGKIISGRHFFADPPMVNSFFSAVQ